jgi:hypothetical protein
MTIFYKFYQSKKNSSNKQKLNNEIYTNFQLKNEYFQNSCKNLKFYKIISNLLNENNFNLISNEFNLISLINTKIKTSNINNNKNNNFLIKNLPKIFNKFHLQNKKITKQIIFLFNNLIKNNNIKFNNFIPEIINIKLDKNSIYKNDLIFFTVNQINNSNLTIETISNSILNLLKKIFKNSNSNINKFAFNLNKILNEHSITNSKKIILIILIIILIILIIIILTILIIILTILIIILIILIII